MTGAVALSSALTTDQCGGSFSRKVTSTHVDIGAYEVDGVLQTAAHLLSSIESPTRTTVPARQSRSAARYARPSKRPNTVAGAIPSPSTRR